MKDLIGVLFIGSLIAGLVSGYWVGALALFLTGLIGLVILRVVAFLADKFPERKTGI